MTEIFNNSESEYNLFRYKPIDKYLIDSLVKSSLWCAKPDTLNDPLDCQINLLKAMERAHSLATGGQKETLRILIDDYDREESFIKKMQNKLPGVGICSFSRLGKFRSASIQWAHYADKHRGVRLSYRIPSSFINDRSHDWDHEKELFGLHPVHYKGDVLTSWLAQTKLAASDFIVGLANCYYTAKSPAWSGEREVRIIRKEHGYLKIPLGYLEKVCFGLNTPTEDIELVKKLASEHCGCKKFSKMERDEKSDFAIKEVRIR